MKTSSILAFLFCLLTGTSLAHASIPCGGASVVRPDLGLGTTADVMPAEGGTATFLVWGSSSCGWSFSENSDWLVNVSRSGPDEDAVITYTVLPNTGAARNAVVTVIGNGTVANYTIPQAAAAQPQSPFSNDPRVLGTPTKCKNIAGTSLKSGVTFAPGTYIVSPGGKFKLIYQTDGNLVVYNNLTNGFVWNNNRLNTGGHMSMQTDGNLVSYGANNHAIWATGTWRYPGAVATMQDDGNLVVYAKDSCTPLWSLR